MFAPHRSPYTDARPVLVDGAADVGAVQAGLVSINIRDEELILSQNFAVTDPRAAANLRWSHPQYAGVGFSSSASYPHANSSLAPSVFPVLPPGSNTTAILGPGAVDETVGTEHNGQRPKTRKPRKRFNDVKSDLHKRVKTISRESGLNDQVVLMYTLRKESLGHHGNKSELTMTPAAQEGLAGVPFDLKELLDQVFMAQ
ncbi:hypothetical protein EIP91_006396 [Steccherinum ochraceum]|uniref:Uncharacterized protein n=1 Tax=Steccherinum ochraceum TaxID=92696 RepID=A0A4R0R8I3_9APHY|nr:hypothetical protein EIP91_006396 [Steccherinum ochraceum]